MEIVNKKIDELIPYEKNPRLNDEAVQYVANSIKEFGFKVPMVIDKNNVIVAGHTRYKASKELGLKEVPCIIADDLTEEQIKAFRLADNKVSETSSWDIELLNEELNEILDIDMKEFNFNLDFDAVSFIDDLMDNGFIGEKAEQLEFGITFQFDITKKEIIENYLRENGKEVVVQKIMEMIEGEENA